jgi:hypothetical protein
VRHWKGPCNPVVGQGQNPHRALVCGARRAIGRVPCSTDDPTAEHGGRLGNGLCQDHATCGRASCRSLTFLGPEAVPAGPADADVRCRCTSTLSLDIPTKCAEYCNGGDGKKKLRAAIYQGNGNDDQGSLTESCLAVERSVRSNREVGLGTGGCERTRTVPSRQRWLRLWQNVGMAGTSISRRKGRPLPDFPCSHASIAGLPCPRFIRHEVIPETRKRLARPTVLISLWR